MYKAPNIRVSVDGTIEIVCWWDGEDDVTSHFFMYPETEARQVGRFFKRTVEVRGAAFNRQYAKVHPDKWTWYESEGEAFAAIAQFMADGTVTGGTASSAANPCAAVRQRLADVLDAKEEKPHA